MLIAQLQLIYQMLGNASLSTLALSASFLWTLCNIWPIVTVWFAVQVALKLIEVWDTRYHVTPEKIAARPYHYLIRLIASQCLHAGGWASLIWITDHYATTNQLAFTILILAGLLGGAVTTYAPNLLVFSAYIAVYVLTGALTFLPIRADQQNPFIQYAALEIFAYCLAIWFNARTCALAQRHSIELGFANAELAQQLREEVNRTRQAHEKLVASNSAKTKFLATTSHDLRQPIHALGLFLSLLEGSDLTPFQRDTLAQARSAVSASTEMLNALLDFSRAEAGIIVPRPHAFALQDVLAELESALAVKAEHKGLVYRSRDTQERIVSDPALIKIILMNLVSNAVRYTDRGGLLVAARSRRDWVALEVWDTGIGIPPDRHEAIFTDFYQIGNSERDSRKGLGLGLAIAARLADLIGARITVHSIPGRGSVFRVILPRHAETPAASASPGPMPAKIQLSGHHALVLDDDEAIRAAMAGLLASFGMSADIAATPDEALRMALARLPAVFLCDFRLRDRAKGTQAALDLRQTLGSDVPTILITGDTHPDRLREASALGFHMLHKPVSAEGLAQALWHELGQ